MLVLQQFWRSIYRSLWPVVPRGLVVLGQQQLLVQYVHPLLPLDVQSGPHTQRRLTARLGACTDADC